MFSKACEYGIRASIHIALVSGQGQRASLKEITEAVDSPVAFTAKILQNLSGDGIIESVKGPNGGYSISEDRIGKISLKDIVQALDGDHIFKGCGLGLKECSDARPCPVHFQFKVIRDDLEEMLRTTTLLHVLNGLNYGTSYLRR